MFTKIYLTILCLFLSLNVLSQETYEVKSLHYLTISSSINPATYHYLKTSFEKLSPTQGDLAVIKMNTPGGLVTTTKDILTLIGESKVPVVIWITPEGASATSAGAIISSGAHLLYMSEGTNIGAATPIQMGQDIKENDGRAKAVNDLAALVSSLSKTRNRNHEAFQKMITEAKSYDAVEAKKDKIINNIANSAKDIKNLIDNQSIKIKGKEYQLSVQNNPKEQSISMGMGMNLLDMLAHPTTAYILFLIGAALIYFELQAPGGFIAGGVGALALILAGIGFQVLPLNFGAFGLIVLAFILFIVEAYITSYGILSLAGIASMIFGSLFLFDTPDSFIELKPQVIFSAVSAIALYLALIAYIFLRSKNLITFFNQKDMKGHVSKCLDEESNLYQIKVNGEIWKAHCDQKLQDNDEIVVTSKKSMILEIKKTQ